jgi:hypothetical protein
MDHDSITDAEREFDSIQANNREEDEGPNVCFLGNFVERSLRLGRSARNALRTFLLAGERLVQ